MNLAEVCGRLHDLDREGTIYAREPWTAASEAVVAIEPDDGALPETARRAGLTYFIEVEIALEILEGWQSHLTVTPTPTGRVQRLIEYALRDA